MAKKDITTVEGLRRKALDALDKAKRAPRFLLGDDDKRWLAAVGRWVATTDADAALASIINEYNDRTG